MSISPTGPLYILPASNHSWELQSETYIFIKHRIYLVLEFLKCFTIRLPNSPQRRNIMKFPLCFPFALTCNTIDAFFFLSLLY